MTDVSYWGTKWAEQAYLEGLLPECGSQDGTPLSARMTWWTAPGGLSDRGC